METTTTSVTPSSVGIRYGLLTGVVSVILSLILYVSGLEQSPARWLSFLVLGGGIFLAHKFFKEHNAGFMSYGQGLSIGATLSGIAGVLGAIFTYLYINFIDTEFIGRAMEKARADMEARGNLTDEQIEQGLTMTARFMTPGLLFIGAILGTLFFGFLLSLLIAAITKNPRPEFE